MFRCSSDVGDINVIIKKGELPELKSCLEKFIKLENLAAKNKELEKYAESIDDKLEGKTASEACGSSESCTYAITESERALAEEGMSAAFRILKLIYNSRTADEADEDAVSINFSELLNDLKYNMLYKDAVLDFDTLTFSCYTHIGGISRYFEINKTSGGAQAEYCFRNGDSYCNRIEIRGNREFYAAITEILRKYAVLEWDGFNNRNSLILDGTKFEFELRLCSGRIISASAVSYYPWNYKKFVNAVVSLFTNLPENMLERTY